MMGVKVMEVMEVVAITLLTHNDDDDGLLWKIQIKSVCLGHRGLVLS